MDEQELNELFGITEDDSQTGAVDQEDADATDEGADEDESVNDNEVEELSEEDSAGEAATHQQTHEANHNFAEARKRAEAELRQERENSARLSQDNKTLMEALKSFGYEGTPQEIADLLVAKRTGDTTENVAKKREEDAQRIQAAVNQSPEVLQARALMKETAKQMAQQDLQNIRKINPDIKSMEDLFRLPEDDWHAIDSLVKTGWRIDKAYAKVCGNNKPQKAQKQDTRSHIKQVNGSGNENAFQVNQEAFELAKSMMPDLTMSDFEKFCRNQQK